MDPTRRMVPDTTVPYDHWPERRKASKRKATQSTADAAAAPRMIQENAT